MVSRMNPLALWCLLAFAAGCGPKPVVPSVDHPYGRWETEQGQSVDVRRDGTFTFCDAGLCDTGHYRPNGQNEVWLIGYSDMKSTQRLRAATGWDRELEYTTIPSDPVLRRSLGLGDGKAPESYKRRRCQGRPCMMVGDFERGDYRFVKVKDY